MSVTSLLTPPAPTDGVNWLEAEIFHCVECKIARDWILAVVSAVLHGLLPIRVRDETRAAILMVYVNATHVVLKAGWR
jgi:hypothetical protein